MRHFVFRLRLPDGRQVSVEADGLPWGWTDAFSRACRTAEHTHGLGPYSGLVCVGYDSHPAAD